MISGGWWWQGIQTGSPPLGGTSYEASSGRHSPLHRQVVYHCTEGLPVVLPATEFDITASIGGCPYPLRDGSRPIPGPLNHPVLPSGGPTPPRQPWFGEPPRGKATAEVGLEGNPQDKTTPELSPSADHTNDTAHHQSSAGPTTQ